MKNFLILVALVFVGVMTWRLSDTISHDAITLAIVFLFGVIAGVPAALIMLAAQRRHEPDYNVQRDYSHQPQPP